ncbi:MAG: UDP-N-acetylmuramoyl-L-alanine--D-glutamate ligase [Gemmatimonadota bacterium]|nr:UDP-N-acetylmuramoyl-L-alanine--D-glutamate ligase [Gemmatimonadota bacterium]
MAERRRRGNELEGNDIAVIGLGASGIAAARLALNKGGNVYVSDVRTDDSASAGGAELRALGARVELGRHDLERLAGADHVVVSPGIPPDAPVLRALAERGVRCISEPEFAVRFFAGPLIAITGTNGKTTTTMLTGHLLEQAGISAGVGGNVGGGFAPPASELALMEPAPAWYVLELSSFQLAGIETLSPDIGVVTNLSPDHLDRYDSVASYYADKARLFDNATETSRWVLPAGDTEVDALIGDTPGRRFHFGDEPRKGTHAFVEEGILTLDVEGREPVLPAADLPLLGRHNRLNALAAVLTARLAGAPVEALGEGLRSARSLPHRMEPVADVAGVLWVNDSKATNVAATRSALQSLTRPVVLLLGGKDKGEDLTVLRGAMGPSVRVVLAYGAAGPRIAAALEGAAEVRLLECGFADVVEEARRWARAGDMVLLSPACSSFDMFRNYEERGRTFASLAGGDAR